MTDDSTIDPFTGEALLLGHGRVEGDPLSDLLDALGGPPLPSETAGGASTIGGMVANVSVAVAARAPSSRRRLTTRVGALAVTGSMFLTSVAAAAVGVPVPVVSEVVPEIADLVPGGSDPSGPAPGVTDESDEGETPGVEQEQPTVAPPGTEPSTIDEEDGPGNSDRATSDCGKPGSEPTGDPDCDAENHGDHVNDGTPNGNGPPDDPGSNGNGNGPPDDPGSNGNGNGQPDDPGSNGNGNGQPDDPGSNGNGNGQPDDPGANGDEDAASNGNGPNESKTPGPNGGGGEQPGQSPGDIGANESGQPDDPGSNGNGSGQPDDPGSNGNGSGQPDDPGSNGNGNGGNGGGAGN